MTENDSVIRDITRRLSVLVDSILHLATGTVDLSGKLVLLDSDELLLVWERKLRDIRLKKEEEAWLAFERQFGKGSPLVTEAFVKWQETLYAYIEHEKERFLRERQGSKTALFNLVRRGAKTVVVTKGAKPYTQKCFNLLGLSPYITHIYSPPPGSRQKQFVDAVLENGVDTLKKCTKDTIVVGHDLEKDMAWDLVPPNGNNDDGHAPVFVLLDTLVFGKDVVAPLDAMTEIIELLSKKGRNDFWRGFKSFKVPGQGKTKNYSFGVTLYGNPNNGHKAKIPLIYDIRPLR
ncbi:MAG: hypothetical protein GXY07_01825 [Candidatus Hydrogenedentes bacterium]|nr:hypothetical protein [Candidatus Hydrogenedentota bacterium]